MIEIPTRYNPKEAEDKWYSYWQENKLFSAKPNNFKKPFCIVIPPPNVTGILHMGHALNNTIQDILIRYHRMKGEESLWMPGTDHAGIATQNVVEKAIAKQGLRRQDLGREKFIERVWQWKEEYGSTIIQQLKKLGSSCEWERERFTMDHEYSKSVVEVFVSLYEKGLIYQGSYIINWCPRCQTALSDEEAPHHEVKGALYYIKYPLKQGLSPQVKAPRPIGRPGAPPSAGTLPAYVVVATTRPETMLGDTAVAVNPKDKRYKHLIGETLILPLAEREIKIIGDSTVDMEFGTGAVKVTPAHDPNDYKLGKKHNLEFINILSSDGRLNQNAGDDYKDLDRFEAREMIIEDLREKGLIDKIEAHQLSAGHCYRCHTIIEPYLSKQWFVKMKPLAKPAIEAVKKSKIKFHPQRWTKVYLNWMENIQDWCISRQIWWGHRLPVYYCKKCLNSATNGRGMMVSRIKPEKCPHCGSLDILQEEDVLDTWFSSWLWPFACFYWPFQMEDEKLKLRQQKDLKYFYPTACLVTAAEIIFFWVARMIMAGEEFMKAAPFKDVYIHGTVRDIEGKKMSKSLGNIIDPLEIINEYGADALRFSLISITAQGQDVYLSKERFEQGRNFANKIWNASRFIITNLDPALINKDLCALFKQERLNLVNRWILSRFYSVLKQVNKSLDSFEFNEAANLLYGFFWHDFCDWYLELIKPVLAKKENNPEYKNTQVVMYKILEKYLRVLHPFMPFITEEIWQKINTGRKSQSPSIIMSQLQPHVQKQIIDQESESSMILVFEIITAIRNLRQDLEIPPGKEIAAVIATSDKKIIASLTLLQENIKIFCKLESLEIEKKYKHIKSNVTILIKGIHITLPLGGRVELEKEKKRIDEKIKKTELEIAAKAKTLNNQEFIKKAPVEIVKKERIKMEELNELLKKLKVVKDGLR